MVTSTFAPPSSMRERIGSGPNAEKSGQKTLLFFRVPIAVTKSSGTRPSRLKTRSPSPTPSARSALAKRDERSASSV